MLVLGAADDVIVRPADVEDTARAYGAPWAIFPMMGHDMMLEQSWEQVAQHLQQWLTTFDGRTAARHDAPAG